MSRALWHRWHADDPAAVPGAGVPDVGDVVYGARAHWRVLEVRPVESRIYPNAWRARLAPLGAHGLSPAELERHLRARHPQAARHWAYVSALPPTVTA